jgi:exosortase/archaeosortase
VWYIRDEYTNCLIYLLQSTPIFFNFFIILFCLLTIIILTQAAKVMQLHKNIIPFTIKHYFKFHNKSHNFILPTTYYQENRLSAHSRVHVLTIWVTWHVSYKRQKLLTLGSPSVFGGIRVLHPFSFPCCVLFVFVLCLLSQHD